MFSAQRRDRRVCVRVIRSDGLLLITYIERGLTPYPGV